MNQPQKLSRLRSWPAAFAVGVAVGVVATAAVLRRRVIDMLTSLRPYETQRSEIQRPCLIINRWSGGGKAEQYGLATAAEAAGIETVLLEPGDDLVELGRCAVERGADALGMAGGDGSLGLVAGVAAEADLPFFCVPAGTRNHFALDVGLDRDDPLAALQAVVNGREIRIDLGFVGERPFLNNVSLGLYPIAVEQDGYRDDRVGTFLKTAEEVGSSDDQLDFRFVTPDGREQHRSPFVMVSNNPYVWAGPPDFGRRQRLDTGNIGVIAVGLPGRGEKLSVTELLVRCAYHEWSAPELEVDSSLDTVAVGVDGESIEMPTPLMIRQQPRGLRLLLPKGTRPGFVAGGPVFKAELETFLGVLGESDS
jgi:diacylglycerol kinase family enzyme